MNNKALSQTTKDIQKAVGAMCLDRFHVMVCENVSAHGIMSHTHEYDVLSISKSGMLNEYEVKVSRQDFLKDAKKMKHDFFSRGSKFCSNYFSYVCPKD